MSENERIVYIQDGDGHWYECPESRMEEAERMLNEFGRYWEDCGYMVDGRDEPPFPDFITQCNRPKKIYKL